MVIHNNFQYILESVPQDTVFNLPAYKENSLEITFGSGHEVETVYNGSKPVLPFASSEVFEASIKDCRRLTARSEECKAVYEVSFDVSESKFNFQAGDTIGIIPSNCDLEVESILTHLDLRSQAVLPYTLASIRPKTKIPPHIPVKSTLGHVFKHCVDVRSVLKKLFLLALSQHTKDENERKVLEYFCSKEGSTAYQTYILGRNMCLLDIFTIFKSCKPPIQVLLANLPRLLPRPYSLVNSSQNSTDIIKICFSVLPLQNNRKGLTTGWLETLILNMENDIVNRMNNLNIGNNCDTSTKVPIYLRKNMSGFSLPETIEKPLILIGPGTGVAPFIGFLEEIEEKRKSNPDIGEVWLFFGCRDPKLDFIYEEELNEFVSKGVLKRLCTAFSRVDYGRAKYIQDSILQNHKEMSSAIDSGASIFVCGDLKNMATQVKDTFTQCLINNGKSQEDAEKLIADMHKEKKYITDAWS